METLWTADTWICAAFNARKALVESLSGDTFDGLAAFKEHWEGIVVKGGGRAAAIIARASVFATQELCDLDLEDLLTCAYEPDKDLKKKKHKWPIFGILFPDLSPWVLAPAESKSSVEEIFKLVERECPDLNSDLGMCEDIIGEGSWGLFLEHGRLCTKMTNDQEDVSLRVKVRDIEMSSNTLRNGAIRMYGLATFLYKLVEYSTKSWCFECEKVSDDLKRCVRCHCALYCSRECQIESFKTGHKLDCKVLAELHKRYDSESPLPKHDKIGAYLAVEASLYPDLRDEVVPTLKDSIMKEVKEQHPDMKDMNAIKNAVYGEAPR